MKEKYEFLHIERREGVVYLTLDRPPLNILDIAMMKEMVLAVESISGDPGTRVLVLASEGKVFSAGVDVADHTAEKVVEMIPLFDQVCRSLVECPVPTICAVHGHALGGGCELVLCCDLAAMAEEAEIGQPEIQMAMIAPISAIRLAHFVGYRTAAEMLFTGRSLNAEQALGVGLVNAVTPANQLSAWVDERAAHIAGLSRAAMQLNKRALQMGFNAWADSLVDIERLYLDDLMGTADAQEGLAAFLEKRTAEWQHK